MVVGQTLQGLVKDGDWYVQSPIDSDDPEISHPIVLTDSMIKSIFEKVKSYGV